MRATPVNRVRSKSVESVGGMPDRDIVQQVLYPVVCVDSSFAAESRQHEIAIAGRDVQREAGCRRHYRARVGRRYGGTGRRRAGDDVAWYRRVIGGSYLVVRCRGCRATVGSCFLPNGGRCSLLGRQRNRAPAGWRWYSSPGTRRRSSSPARIRLSLASGGR